MIVCLLITGGLIGPQLPDTIDTFVTQEIFTYQNKLYFKANYIGDKNIMSALDYDDYLAALKPEVVINILGVTNKLSGFDDKAHEHTVTENSNSVVSGDGLLGLYEKGLRKLRVPFVRTDTGRKSYMIANIAADGTFSALVNFKTGGEWVVTSDLLNNELSPEKRELFSLVIIKQTFKVY